jgi:NAD-dependent dihydropyrimidine dehydrogenase PreA subunit
MWQVDREQCTGCGDCLDVCPVEAIFMLAGKAAIDADTCITCEACLAVCPVGAIRESMLPIPHPEAALQPANKPTTLAVPASSPETSFAWTKPVLSYVGQEIFPRLVDLLIAGLDRRLSNPPQAHATSDIETVIRKEGGRRQLRRRRRGNRL